MSASPSDGIASINPLSAAHAVTTGSAPARLDDKMLSSRQSDGYVEGHWVKIPDLFTSIMSKEPVVNELYKESKLASDEWLLE